MSKEDRLWNALVHQAEIRGFAVVVRQSAASADAFVDYLKREVVVARRLTKTDAVARLAHEIGHLELHADGRDTLVPNAGRREIEAELFAYGVLVNHGIEPDRSSVEYMRDWIQSIGPLTQGDFEALEARMVPAVRRVVLSMRNESTQDVTPAQPDLDGLGL